MLETSQNFFCFIRNVTKNPCVSKQPEAGYRLQSKGDNMFGSLRPHASARQSALSIMVLCFAKCKQGTLLKVWRGWAFKMVVCTDHYVQTNKQTDRRTDATKRIISPASRLIKIFY